MLPVCFVTLTCSQTFGACCSHRAVCAAVLIMGDHFGPINFVGLLIVILGVLLFNLYKYRKILQVRARRSGAARFVRARGMAAEHPGLEPHSTLLSDVPSKGRLHPFLLSNATG